MRDVYLQAEKLFHLCTTALLVMLLSSCIIYIYEDDAVSLDAKKYLEANFSGTFTDGREISLNSSRYDNYSYDNRLFRFYSSALKQDVSVLAQPYYDNSRITGYYYTTNYLFLKYAKDITESAEKMIASDFSDVKVLYDFDWMFSNDSENSSKENFLIYNSYTIHKVAKFILIHASEEELTDLENRIKSVIFTYRYENSVSSELRFFITSPASETENHIDFSSVSVDDLFNKQFRSKFYKCYICNENHMNYEVLD